ncbi:hypothetical protein QJS04_geneDACA007417 [Acorus gramineus]|uniref:General transcription factor 3C polypeptide 3 n=1 Tax=Acorus gramineus TaxID=55184 RepID=A0AAV9BQX9_ACOGR|nr:hypothetical protein QJS04_geneDACA007417 [Acorus gramineus]
MAEGEGGEAFDGKDDDEEEDIDYEVGEEEEEEEEDDVEDGGYTFRFDGGVDPLDFVEGDGTAEGGLQLYERLERLEHEQRKRKALDELRQCDESVKKPRQEDFFGASMDEIMEAMELGSHRRRSGKLKKRGRRTGSRNKLNPEITRMLRDATLHYASGLYDEMHRTYGQIDRAIGILEDYVKVHASEADLGVVDLLAEMLMKNKEHLKALQHIEYAGSVVCSGKDLPSYLTVKAGMCHACLGNLEEAQLHFRDLQVENAGRDGKRITEVADLFFELGHFDYALKYYFMLEVANIHENGNVHLKIAQCYLSSKEHAKATPYFYKALSKMENSVDVRLILCSLLIEEKKEDEAISLLSAPKDLDRNSWGPKPFWLCGIIRMRLAQIYHSKGMLENFVDAILSPVRETLFVETRNQKVRTKKRLTRSVLIERSKLLDDHQDDDVFVGFTPIAHPSDKVRAYRAKKSLKKIEAIKEEKKAAALAAGQTWHSDESEDEKSEALWEPPLPKLLKDEEHYQLILALCKALASLKRYWEALEIINHCLKFVSNTIPVEKEELRSLGAREY